MRNKPNFPFNITVIPYVSKKINSKDILISNKYLCPFMVDFAKLTACTDFLFGAFEINLLVSVRFLPFSAPITGYSLSFSAGGVI